jgi:uncharacterized membrane protein YhiD involved in acid resistance
VGLATGSGFELLAGVAVALTLLVLRGFEWLKRRLGLGSPEDQP